jgi:hypothetical protein
VNYIQSVRLHHTLKVNYTTLHSVFRIQVHRFVASNINGFVAAWDSSQHWCPADQAAAQAANILGTLRKHLTAHATPGWEVPVCIVQNTMTMKFKLMLQEKQKLKAYENQLLDEKRELQLRVKALEADLN